MKHTKIVATLGPASETRGTIKKMIQAGANVFRLNFSHGNYANHRLLIQNARAAEKELGVKVGIMADIQGPRIRVANAKPLKIKKGEKIFVTDKRSPHNHDYKKELHLDWNGFYEYLQVGKKIFIEDGLIQLEVTRRFREGVAARVLIGQEIRPHKGVNIPSISHHMGFLTDKDLRDLEFVLAQDIDFVAASFVANDRDLENLKSIMIHFLSRRGVKVESEKAGASSGGNKKVKKSIVKIPWIVSKVERSVAVKNIKKIIQHSDAIMVARGDLAIEEPQEKVGVYQKDIISACLRAKKPVIVATQMMASMVDNIRPTRAELSDVTNAVVDNADAIMFSNETAVGKYPVEVIQTASRVIASAEKSPYNDVALKKRNKFARLLSRLVKEPKKKKRPGRKRVLRVKTLEELREFSSLRQERVRLRLTCRDAGEKRKAALIWSSF